MQKLSIPATLINPSSPPAKQFIKKSINSTEKTDVWRNELIIYNKTTIRSEQG
jgi:hypothetical protein